MTEKKLAVLGAGTMGSGIAQLAAQNGFEVLLYDIKGEFVERGLSNIRSNLQRRVDSGKLPVEEMRAILERIRTATNRDDAASYPVVIEAAPEDMDLKREIFSSLSEKGGPETVLATNTSSLSITSIAAASKHPGQVVGLHFFNPAPVMPLVEVIAGVQTAPEVVEAVRGLAQELGKTPVRSADSPGFIVNRVARPFYGESFKIVGDGYAGVAQVDSVMRGTGFRMGPFELMDLIGIDINFAVTRSVFEAFFYEPRYRPHPIQQRMVEAGNLGRKTGSGFYSYQDGERGEPAWSSMGTRLHERRHPIIDPTVAAEFLRRGNIALPEEAQPHAEIAVRVLAMIINEAASAVGEGVASVRDVDIAMRLGTNYPEGPLKWADMIGLDLVYTVLRNLQEILGEDRYRPAPLLYDLVMSGAVGDVAGAGFHFPGEKGMV